jgi:two-component system phosphate regulon sensor histidine kinase PhoR
VAAFSCQPAHHPGAVLLISWFGLSSVRNFYFLQMERGLESRAQLIREHVLLLRSSPKDLQDFCRRAGRQGSTRITIILRDGRVLADSNEDPARMNNHADRPEVQSALAGKSGKSIRFSRTLKENMLYVAVPLADDTGRFTGVLRLSVATTSIEGVLHSMYITVLVDCLFVVFAAAMATLIFSRRISRPLEEMKHGAERMARGVMDTQLSIDQDRTSAEVAGLATSLNRMAAQVNERVRTITLQKNELETVFSSMTEMVIAIDQEGKILRINRSTAEFFHILPDIVQGKPIKKVFENRGLLELVDQVFDSSVKVERDIIVHADREQLHLHARAVSLRDENYDPQGVLIVLTDLTRLHRLENLGGTGLGLSIVKHIAMAHDGTVSVESRPGYGSIFSIILPIT